MRDGRRKRLGLQEGGGADASQSDFLDRILLDTDVAGEPNILSLEPDANVRTTDQRYLSDAYNYFLGGGFDAAQDNFVTPPSGEGGGGSGDGGQATSGVNATTGTNTSEQQRLINEGIGVQLEPGAPVVAPGEIPVTQQEMDDFNAGLTADQGGGVGGSYDEEVGINTPADFTVPDSTYDEEVGINTPFTVPDSTYDEEILPTQTYYDGNATLQDAGASEDGMQLAEVGLGDEADFTPSSTYDAAGLDVVEDNPYGINPNTGEPYQTPRTIADQNAILGQTFAAEDVDSEGNLLESGINKMKSIFPDFDPLMAIGKIAFNNYIGAPITLAVDVLKAVLPEQDPRQTVLDEFYTTGEGAQYMDPSNPNYIPGMENYNTVSGGGLNMITGGRLGEETTYGLQEAYQDRIDTIENTLADKYGMTAAEIADVKAGSYTGDVDSDLLNRLNLLEEAKAKESDILSLYEGDIDERDQMLEDISLQNKINAGIQAADDDSGSEMLDTSTPFDADTFDDNVTLTGTPPAGIDKVTFGSEEPSITPLEDDFESLVDTPSDQDIINRGGGDDISTGGLDPNRGQQVDRGSSGAGDNQPVSTTTGPPSTGFQPQSTYDSELEDDRDVGGGGGGGGGGKIVCTMMNESYGFGSFRNKIWMKFHKDLSPEYQKGYHKIFLPLIKIAKTNTIVKKVLEHIAVHSTIDMRQATRGKTHLLGRVYRKILLPLCYWVGKNAK